MEIDTVAGILLLVKFLENDSTDITTEVSSSCNRK